MGKDTVFWDSELPGFGVRVYPSGSKYYVVQARGGGKAAQRVTELHHSLRATPVMANQVVGTLSPIWNAAENRGLVPEASNPCRLVVLLNIPRMDGNPYVIPGKIRGTCET